MTKKTRTSGVILIIFILLIADHLTKLIAIACLKESGQIYSFLGDTFRLQYAENTGAFLSLGSSLSPAIRTLVMVGFNTVILGALVCYLFFAKDIQKILLVAFSLIASGGIGNLLDRIFRDGSVVDFMNVGIQFRHFSLRTGIFNIADIAIMLGLFMIVVNELIAMKYGALKEGGKAEDNPH